MGVIIGYVASFFAGVILGQLVLLIFIGANANKRKW